MAAASLSSGDVRRALALAGEACELPRGSRERTLHALGGLAKLVGAQVVVLAEVRAGPPTQLTPRLDFGWSGERERRVFADYAGPREAIPDPSLPRMLERSARALREGATWTALRSELIGERDWYRSAHVQELRRAGRVDAFLASGSAGCGAARVFSFHRAWGERPFSARDAALVGAFHAGCPWLHQLPEEPKAGAPEPLAALPARLRQVLALLAAGLSEKQAAAELGLSGHTVHDYVKALHKRLGVASRGELLARALARRS